MAEPRAGSIVGGVLMFVALLYVWWCVHVGRAVDREVAAICGSVAIGDDAEAFWTKMARLPPGRKERRDVGGGGGYFYFELGDVLTFSRAFCRVDFVEGRVVATVAARVDE